MLNKSNHDIAKDISPMLDQPISIKSISESNVSLPKMCRLHIREDNMLIIH
jgi:hypothetical protein